RHGDRADGHQQRADQADAALAHRRGGGDGMRGLQVHRAALPLPQSGRMATRLARIAISIRRNSSTPAASMPAVMSARTSALTAKILSRAGPAASVVSTSLARRSEGSGA